MSTIARYEEIQGWQLARTLVRQIYAISSDGAFSRDFAQRDQIRRAAISTMANPAEGFGRRSDREFARFLEIAKGSALETQSFLYVALDVGHIQEAQFKELYDICNQVAGKLVAFIAYLLRSADAPGASEQE